MRKIILLFLLSCFSVQVDAAIFDCNNLGDGAGNASNRTLRYCITQANLTAGKDTINFSVAGTITVGSNYPVISYPLVINGFSAPGAVQGQLGTAVRQLTVVLNGPGSSTVYGFQITAANCEIKGLVIQDFFKGIHISGSSATNNWIWGNYIGTSANGLSSSASEACYDDGIAINTNSVNNIIGTNGDGTNDANEGNLISANGDGGQFNGEGVAINEGGTISTNCSGNRVSGNYIGTNETGTAALYSMSVVNTQRGSGVQVNYSTGNIIGTNGDGISDALERNIISGNTDCGIVFIGGSSNKIKGNYLGTDKTGLVGLANYANGGTSIIAVQVSIKTASNSNFVGTDGDGVADADEGNVVGSVTFAAGSNNSYNYGLFIQASTGNRVSGNKIGIGSDGITPLNIKCPGSIYTDKCIYISSASTSTIVGTNADGVSDALESNYFGNSGDGVTINASSSCIVAGNYFGLGTDLTTAETLTNSAVTLFDATSCRVGSSGSNNLERNYICNGSMYGVWIDGNLTANNDLNNIRYNTFGMRPDGVAAPNALNAIYLWKQSNANTIQYNILTNTGTNTSAGNSAIRIGNTGSNEQVSNTVVNNNTIYKNLSNGITIFNSSSVANLITENSIYNNGDPSTTATKQRLGIDLNNDGVTLNDSRDNDSGPNDYSNFPVITGASLSGDGCTSTATISGTFNGLPGTDYYIELYSNDVCNGDTSGTDYFSESLYNYGEGKTYIGSTSIFTTISSGSGQGNANWTSNVPLTVNGRYITAIAIQKSGSNINNTSEFSQCYFTENYDCGDAPDSYKTLLASCGPKHRNTSNTLKIGPTYDNDTDGVPSVDADGDGLDEDGIAVLPLLTASSTSYAISAIPVTNNTGFTATLYAWIDLNLNGSFEATEFVTVAVPSIGAQNINLAFPCASCNTFICGFSQIPSNTYLRLRLTTDVLIDNVITTNTDERSYGPASNGEVEDYRIFVAAYDFGDLPNTYPVATTVCLDNSATDKVWAGVEKPSTECFQKFSADATGDGAEEDGLTTAIGPPGASYNWVIRLNANQANKTVYFGLWIDWDGNGNFTSSLDAFYTGSAVVNGVTNRNVSVATPYGGSNAVFRVMASDAPITSGMFNATINNGEIEDYTILRILAAPGNILMGMRHSTGNLLKWKNTSGMPVTNYTLERSFDNLTWTTLKTVVAAADNSSLQYSYTDIQAEKENYYRLKFTLPDGTYQHSNIVPLFEKNNSTPVIIYPNPAKNSLTIQTPNNHYSSFQIMDPAGRLELKQDITSMNTVVNISNLAPGTHLIKFITKRGQEEVQRFVKIK